MKRFFALLLAMVMVLQLCPLPAMAEIDYSRFRTAESVNDVTRATFVQVTLQYDDGTTFDDGKTYKKYNVASGSTFSEQIPELAAKEGYSADGWYNGENKLEADTLINTSITYTARYTLQSGYNLVTFYNRDAQVIETRTVETGNAIGTLPAVIEREDYIAYWAIGEIRHNGQSNETVVTGSRIDASYVVNGNIEVVSDYDAIEYTVSFYNNQDDTEAAYTRKVTASTSYCVNDIPDVPDKAGYSGEWVYIDGKFTNAVSVTADTRVWVEYTQNVFTVKFMVGEQIYKTDTYNSGATLGLPAEPVVEGKQFVGWYVGETKYNGGETVSSDLILIAAFEDEYAVTFVVHEDGGSEERLSQYFRTGGEAIGTMPQNPFVSGISCPRRALRATGRYSRKPERSSMPSTII